MVVFHSNPTILNSESFQIAFTKFPCSLFFQNAQCWFQRKFHSIKGNYNNILFGPFTKRCCRCCYCCCWTLLLMFLVSAGATGWKTKNEKQKKNIQKAEICLSICSLFCEFFAKRKRKTFIFLWWLYLFHSLLIYFTYLFVCKETALAF